MPQIVLCRLGGWDMYLSTVSHRAKAVLSVSTMPEHQLDGPLLLQRSPKAEKEAAQCGHEGWALTVCTACSSTSTAAVRGGLWGCGPGNQQRLLQRPQGMSKNWCQSPNRSSKVRGASRFGRNQGSSFNKMVEDGDSGQKWRK